MSFTRNDSNRLIVVALDGDIERRGGASTAFDCHESASERGSLDGIGGGDDRGAKSYGTEGESMPAKSMNSAVPPPTVFDYYRGANAYYGGPAKYTRSTTPPPRVDTVVVPPPSPEPPRWRFINEAKKTSGYSSDSAGTPVQGLSSEELAGSYNARWRTMGGTQREAAAGTTAREPNAEAGRPEKDRRTVGRLSLRKDAGPAEEETLVGRFVGFRTRSAAEQKIESPGNVTAPTASDEDSSTVATAIATVTTITTSDILDELDRAEKQLKAGRPPSPAPVAPTPPTSSELSSEGSGGGSVPLPEDGWGAKGDSRRQVILLNLLLLGIFAAILVAVSSGGPKGEGVEVNEEVDGHRAVLPWGSYDNEMAALPWEPDDYETANPLTSAPTRNATAPWEPDDYEALNVPTSVPTRNATAPWESEDYEALNVPTSVPTRNATEWHFAIWVG